MVNLPVSAQNEASDEGVITGADQAPGADVQKLMGPRFKGDEERESGGVFAWVLACNYVCG